MTILAGIFKISIRVLLVVIAVAINEIENYRLEQENKETPVLENKESEFATNEQ